MSAQPGTVGGHRASRIYGRLDCPSAKRAIVNGGYAAHRVFFADEAYGRRRRLPAVRAVYARVLSRLEGVTGQERRRRRTITLSPR